MMFWILVFSFLGSLLCSFGQNLTYVYPLPNTGMHSIKTPIILKFDAPIENCSYCTKIQIYGEKSGIHNYKYSLSNDKKTISIESLKPFSVNEKVAIKVGNKEYSFTTTSVSPEEQKIFFSAYFPNYFPELSSAFLSKGNQKQTDITLQDTVPQDFPTVIINSVRNPAPGYIYIANFGMGAERSYLMILDNNGKPVKYKKVPLPGFDFKMQPNGLITNAHIITSHIPQGWGWAEAYMEVMDQNLNIIDTVQCKGGYIADFHDFKILPNGHYLLISYDPQPIDMSKVVDGGNPNAIVLGSIIQELDAQKNVVFQWRSWDHIPITDAYSPLTGIAVDPVHINAVELDYDGNLLISSRHLSEITKISRETGEIIWRLGGKKNMFTFINEHSENAPTYFSYQHDIRRQPNGNITLYDNGNQHPTPYSRAVEYKLDEENLTAELVWEYRNNPDIYGETMGSTQRLPNGNTVIGWGGVTSGHIRIVTEVNPKGEIEFELSFPKGVTFQTTSYRAYRFPYPPGLPDVVVEKEEISSIISPGNPLYDTLHFKENEKETGVSIVFHQLSDESPSKITVEKYSYAPLYPKFLNETPLVNSYKVIVKSENIFQFNGKIILDLSKFPLLIHRKNLAIWRRGNQYEPFLPLPSNYDETNGILIGLVNNLNGEYIIATGDFKKKPDPPILTAPPNNAVLNSQKKITFQWTPRNIVLTSEILIAKDENFVNVVFNTNGLKENILTISPLPAGKYFWKVRCANPYGQSEWSEAFSFEVKQPFLRVLSPKTGDKLSQESNFLIEWEHNLDPDFMITLYNNNQPVLNIIDSIYSVFGKYIWNVPNTLQIGNNYKIRITSLKNNQNYAESGVFSIQGPNSVEEAFQKINIFPNPSKGNLTIETKDEEIISIKIFNLFGNEVMHFTDSISNFNGIVFDLSSFPSGLYTILIKTNKRSLFEKFTLINN
ncbi:MAG: aryl-sulfate sulfotransferase [Ignavibacteria bacterium]|nr:aryl-sulfate sulfotransferase [Ignavibacteria bacterium]